MWLDRYPHAFIAAPQLMRSFDPGLAVQVWFGGRVFFGELELDKKKGTPW